MKAIIILCLVALIVSAEDQLVKAREADPVGHLPAAVHKCIFNVVKDNPAVLKKVQACLDEGPNALKCLKDINELAECLKNVPV
jgi:hypothetical protein